MKSIPRKRLWQLAGFLAADALLFGLTDAAKVPSFVLIIGFLLVAATIYYLIYGLLAFARLYGLSVKRKRRLAGWMTAVAASLLALQSIGQLNAHDVVVLLPLAVLGYFYSFYGKAGLKGPAA